MQYFPISRIQIIFTSEKFEEITKYEDATYRILI